MEHVATLMRLAIAGVLVMGLSGPVVAGDALDALRDRTVKPPKSEVDVVEELLRGPGATKTLPPSPPPGYTIIEQKKWLCIADMTTGFAFENGKWARVDFLTEDNRFIVSRKQVVGSTKVRYHVTKFGEKFGRQCDPDFPNEQGFLFCEGVANFKINTNTGRYMRVYPFGFIDGIDNNNNTPLIEIGKCSPF